MLDVAEDLQASFFEVTTAAAFLASADSGMMTGETVNFDQSVWGGYGASPVPDEPLSL